ncbi:hypothetical protein [Streptosporangium sp. KLBMP 9127]|nr:hypothetical protein [Streptosporangium sp. KLBMP 9127]
MLDGHLHRLRLPARGRLAQRRGDADSTADPCGDLGERLDFAKQLVEIATGTAYGGQRGAERKR